MFLLRASFWQRLLSTDLEGGAGFSIAIVAVILVWILFDRFGQS